MTPGTVRSLALLAAAAAVSLPGDAQAAATVTVHNMFAVGLSDYQPLSEVQRAQISITTTLVEWTRSETVRGQGSLVAAYGLTSGGFWPGGAYIQATASAEPDGWASGTYALHVTIDVTNGTGSDLPQLILGTWFSAFAPFVSSEAAVERAPLEYALFDTRQSGEGIGDGHGCDTRLIEANPNYIYDSTPPTLACGVPSPDHSQLEAFVGNIRAGETTQLHYTLSLTVEAFSVIEPASLALFAPSALAMLALRRRRG